MHSLSGSGESINMENLLERSIEKAQSANRAQLVSMIVGVVIAVIMFVAVAIPIAQSVIDNASLTGTPALVVQQVPTFLAIGALVVVASIL